MPATAGAAGAVGEVAGVVAGAAGAAGVGALGAGKRAGMVPTQQRAGARAMRNNATVVLCI